MGGVEFYEFVDFVGELIAFGERETVFMLDVWKTIFMVRGLLVDGLNIRRS